MTDPSLIAALVGLLVALSALVREWAKDRAFRRHIKQRQLAAEEDDDASNH